MGIAEQCALSPVRMLVDGIHRHNRISHGRRPRRFVVHPAVLDSLKASIGKDAFIHLQHGEDGSLRFMGVLVIPDVQATRPKLITHDNEVLYL